MPYLSIDKCATSYLRSELEKLGLPNTKPRRACIDLLRKHGVIVIEVEPEVDQVKPKQSKTKVTQERVTQQNQRGGTTDRDFINVFDVSTTPLTNEFVPGQGTGTMEFLNNNNVINTTDAMFSSALINTLTVGTNLYVNGFNITEEMTRIKHLRMLLLEDFENIRTVFTNMKVAFQNTLNQNLPMYNVAHDIAFESFYTTFQFTQSGPEYTVTDPSFYGRLEDTTVNAEMNLTVVFEESDLQRPDKFTIDLPYMFDTAVLEMVPVMVTTYFGYNDVSGEYAFRSSISHGYIHKDDPTRLTVFCSLLGDKVYNRFQFDIALRYFGLLENEILAPCRFSSMYGRNTTSTSGNTIDHQWTILDNRVELFTNVNVVSVPDGTDTIYVDLPKPRNVSPVTNIIGYGTVHYTTSFNNLNVVVYTSNTPLVYITNDDPTRVCIKSSLLKGFNAVNNPVQTLKAALHISYMHSQSLDLVHSVHSDKLFYEPGDLVTIRWETKMPINSYYFDTISVNGTNVRPMLMGSQRSWYVTWTVPNEMSTNDPILILIQSTSYNFESTFNVAQVDVNGISQDEVDVSVQNVDEHSLRVILNGITDSTDISHTVRVIATRNERGVGTIDFDEVVSTTFTRSSPALDTLVGGLMDGTSYSISIEFTDYLGRTMIHNTQSDWTTISYGRPSFYDVSVTDPQRGLVSAMGYVYHSNIVNWYAFATEEELTDTDESIVTFATSTSNTNGVISGNTEFIQANLTSCYSNIENDALLSPLSNIAYVHLLGVDTDAMSQSHVLRNTGVVYLNRVTSIVPSVANISVPDLLNNGISYRAVTLYPANVEDLSVTSNIPTLVSNIYRYLDSDNTFVVDVSTSDLSTLPPSGNITLQIDTFHHETVHDTVTLVSSD